MANVKIVVLFSIVVLAILFTSQLFREESENQTSEKIQIPNNDQAEHINLIDIGLLIEASPTIITENGCRFIQQQETTSSFTLGSSFSEKMDPNEFHVFFWEESEYHSLIEMNGTKISCEDYCLKTRFKIWYNKYTDGQIGYTMNHAKTLRVMDELEKENIHKDADVLVMISNCISERMNYVNDLIKHIQEVIPDIKIRCGACFDNNHPECPSKNVDLLDQLIDGLLDTVLF